MVILLYTIVILSYNIQTTIYQPDFKDTIYVPPIRSVALYK